MADSFWAPKIARSRAVTLPLELSKLHHRPIDWMLDSGIVEAAIFSRKSAPDPELVAETSRLLAGIDGVHGQLPEHRDFEVCAALDKVGGPAVLLPHSIERATSLRRTFQHDDPPFSGGERDALSCVALYRVTKDPRHLELARHYLDIRGRPDAVGRSRHNQSYKPVVDQTEAVGHAVNCVTLILSMLEVGLASGDRRYADAALRMWSDIVTGKIYVTGGVGTSGNEGFGEAYDLPNISAYSETCAVLMFARLNHRLHLATGDARYIDVLERGIYNNATAGVSASGDRFFYVNRLASAGDGRDQRWQNASLECCPPNLVRFMASMPEYMFARGRDGAIHINLYASSSTSFDVGGKMLGLEIKSGLPWAGDTEITVSAAQPTRAAIKLRIPGWARGEAMPGGLYRFDDAVEVPCSIALNGKALPAAPDAMGYVTIDREWHAGDRIALVFPLAVRRIAADRRVGACVRRRAFQRGPIVYCAEWPDTPGHRVLGLVVEPEAAVAERFEPDFMGGAVLLDTVGHDVADPDRTRHPVRLIPYHLWANRGAGEMSVWLLADDLQVGDIGPAGGLIFHKNPDAGRDGWRYLEAAPADQSQSAQWGGFRRSIAGAAGTAIGTGRQNTQDMLAAKLEPGSAAQIAGAFTLNGVGGWFLPSRDELAAMYRALAANGLGKFGIQGMADNCEYWASTQLSADMASHIDFADSGRVHGDDKDFPRRVRVVRAI